MEPLVLSMLRIKGTFLQPPQLERKARSQLLQFGLDGRRLGIGAFRLVDQGLPLFGFCLGHFAKYIAISSLMGSAMLALDFGTPLSNIALKALLGTMLYALLLILVDRTARELAQRLWSSVVGKSTGG